MTFAPSIGYAGTIAPNVAWANMQKALACQYMVDGPADAAVSATSDGSRQVHVATGFLGGQGILDQITADETVTLDAVATGAHYWLICAHRDWSANATTIAAVDSGTALPASMPTRATSPGVLDDQPLALVKITPDGKTAVVYDLRPVGGPDSYIMSADLASQPNWFAYMARAGVRIRCGNTTYTRTIDPQTLNPVWDVDPTVVHSGPGYTNGLSITNESGWSVHSEWDQRATRSGSTITLRLQARRGGADIDCDSHGGLGDVTILNVGNSAFRPPYDVSGDFRYRDGNASYHGGCTLRTSGDLVLESGLPTTSISHQDIVAGARPSVLVVLTWEREN